MRAKVKSYVRLTVISRVFGLQLKNLSDRKVTEHLIDGVKQYDLEEVVEKCGDMIIDKLKPNHTAKSGQSLSQLKTEEQVEKVRRIRMDNDVREGLLVDAEEMMIAYGRKVKAVCDVLDKIPMQVKTQAPTVPQAVLSVVVKAVNDARNKAANHKLEPNGDS